MSRKFLGLVALGAAALMLSVVVSQSEAGHCGKSKKHAGYCCPPVCHHVCAPVCHHVCAPVCAPICAAPVHVCAAPVPVCCAPAPVCAAPAYHDHHHGHGGVAPYGADPGLEVAPIPGEAPDAPPAPPAEDI